MKKLILFILLSLYLFAEEDAIAGASQLKENFPIVTQEIFFKKFKKEFDKGDTYRKNKTILVKKLDENFYHISDEGKEYKASKKYTDSNYEYIGQSNGEYKVFISSQFYKVLILNKEKLKEHDLPLVFYLQEGWEGFSKVEEGSIIFMREKPFTLFQINKSELDKRFIKIK